MMRILIMSAWLLLLAGCDSHKVPPTLPKVEAPPPSQDKLFDSQRHALKQAGQLDDKLRHDAAAQQQAIDRQAQ